MATFEDAQAGWKVLQSFDFTLTLDEINERLVRMGRSPVSPRTFAHYFKLRRYGYEQYIPINQLDVKTLENPVWDVASRNRYPLVETRLPVKVRVVDEREGSAFRGESTHISEGVAAIRLRNKAAFLLFGSRTSWKNVRIEVEFLDAGQREHVIVDSLTLDLEKSAVNLRVSFTRHLALERVLQRSPLAPTRFRIVVERPIGPDVALADLVEDLWWLFQALETSRAICQEVLQSLDAEKKFVLPSTRVRRLSLESPLELLVDGNVPQILLVYFSLRGLIRLQGDYWSTQMKKEEALEKRAANRSAGIRPRLDTDKLVNATTRVMHNILVAAKADLAKTGIDIGRIRSLVQKHLQRSIEGLLEDESGVQIDLTDETAYLARSIEEEFQGGGAEHSPADNNDSRA